MSDLLARTYDWRVVDAVVNHPSVLRYLVENPADTTYLNSAALLAINGTVALFGEYGGYIFVPYAPGRCDAHGATLPEGRGTWARNAFLEALGWMFTNTDAHYIRGQIRKNPAACAMLRSVGFFDMGVTDLWRQFAMPKWKFGAVRCQ